MKFRPGYLALAPLAPLGAAVAHAVLMPKKKSAYQPQPDADRAARIIEMCKGMDEKDLAKMANAAAAIKLVRGLSDSLGA